ncbi:DUF4386 family protein [Chloroflexota bacterium]
MTKQKEFNIDPSWKGVIKWGGLSLFAAGLIAVIFILSVIITQQTIPVPAGEILENPVRPTLLFLFVTIGELLLLPGGLALYFSLKDVKNPPMLIATGLWVMGVPMFLASRGMIISLSQLSGRYIDTTSETMQAAYLASAELALEIQNIYAMMGVILILCVASIMIGVVMLKGVFGKLIGYLVIAAGVFSLFTPLAVILSVPTILLFPGIALSAVWQLIVGIKLYKLGKEV